MCQLSNALTKNDAEQDGENGESCITVFYHAIATTQLVLFTESNT